MKSIGAIITPCGRRKRFGSGEKHGAVEPPARGPERRIFYRGLILFREMVLLIFVSG